MQLPSVRNMMTRSVLIGCTQCIQLIVDDLYPTGTLLIGNDRHNATGSVLYNVHTIMPSPITSYMHTHFCCTS